MSDKRLWKIKSVQNVRQRVLGGYLHELRELAGLSQKSMGEKVGVDLFTFIDQIEKGRVAIPEPYYDAFAGAYGVSIADFRRFCDSPLQSFDYHYTLLLASRSDRILAVSHQCL